MCVCVCVYLSSLIAQKHKSQLERQSSHLAIAMRGQTTPHSEGVLCRPISVASRATEEADRTVERDMLRLLAQLHCLHAEVSPCSCYYYRNTMYYVDRTAFAHISH